MPYVAPVTKSANTKLSSAEYNVLVNDIIDLNARLTTGTYAARPASPTIGQLYYQTNTDELVKYVTDADGTNRWMLADHDYRRNFVINGGFDVWQRATTFNPVSATGTTGLNYGADRWQFLQSTTSASAFTRQAVTPSDPAGFNYYLRVQRANTLTHTTPYIIQTSFESQNIQSIRGKYVTLSFWARRGANYSSSSNMLEVKIVSGQGTDNTVSGFTTPATDTSLPSLSTSWQRFSFSTLMTTTSTQLGALFIFTPSGTAGAADYYDITGVQLEVGTAPSDFENRDAGEELRRCQRYYYRTGPYSAGPQSYGAGYCSTTSNARISISFPVTLRTAPTALEASGASGTNFAVANLAVTTLCTSQPTFYTATNNTAVVNFITGATLTAGGGALGANNGVATGYLAWNVEL